MESNFKAGCPTTILDLRHYFSGNVGFFEDAFGDRYRCQSWDLEIPRLDCGGGL
jgi:hypothetical protein